MINGSLMFGVLIAISSIAPLYGRVFGIPAIAISSIFIIAATLAVPKWKAKTSVPVVIVAGLFCAYAVLVAISAFAEQWDYFFIPSNWLHHSDDYVGSKLLMFVITSAPALYLGLLFSTFSGGRKITYDGLACGFVAVATAAAIRTAIDGFPYLASTDYDTARVFLIDPERPYSTVSYGILFALGAAFATPHRRLWPFTALFLFMAAWLDRKTETTLIILFIIGQVFFSVWHHKNLKPILARSSAILAIAVGLFVPLHNQANIDTWRYLSNNARYRVAILENQKWDGNTHAAVASKIITRLQADERIQGLGSYAIYSVNAEVPYPHNLLVETYQEIGLTATVLLGALVLFSGGLALLQIMRCANLETFPILCALSAVFLIAMKSGDITNVGRVVFFALLCSAAATRPLPQPTSAIARYPLTTSSSQT